MFYCIFMLQFFRPYPSAFPPFASMNTFKSLSASIHLSAVRRQLHLLLRRRNDREHAGASHEERGRIEPDRRRRRFPHPRRPLHVLLSHCWICKKFLLKVEYIRSCLL